MLINFILYATLQGLDVWTTLGFMDLGGEELNPVALWALDNDLLFVIKLLGTVSVIVLITYISQRNYRIGLWSMTTLNVFMVAVVATNLVYINMLGG